MDRYCCGYCGIRYVVTVLARDCEANHEREYDSPRVRKQTSEASSQVEADRR